MEAKEGATIIDEVEFHVAATTIQLESALALPKGHRFSALNDGKIGVEIMITDALHEFEATFKTPGVEIIKKQPTDASRFIPVLQEEVVITPFLILGIDLFAKGNTGLPCGLMPGHRVFFKGVIRGQVKPAAKPPNRSFMFFFSEKETDIGVRRRHIGVSWMNHQRHPQGLKSSPLKISAMGGSRCGEGMPRDMGKVDAPLFYDRTTGQNPRPAAADAAGIGPLILLEKGIRLLGGKTVANPVLKI